MGTFSYQYPPTTGQFISYTTIDGTTCTVASNTSVSGAVTLPASASDGTNFYQVVSISDNAFYNNATLTSIDLSECTFLTRIGSNAFYNTD